MKTAVIILNWNGKQLLQKFLPTVLTTLEGEDSEVIVADNGSEDGSQLFLQEHFPNVRTILFEKNHGFAGGYNLAIGQVDAEYVVLLNSDIEPSPGWLSPMVDFMDKNPDVAAVQPKIRSYKEPDKFEYAGAAGGFIDRYGFPFCRGRILGTLEKDRGQYDNPIQIFWATGACMLIRRNDYINSGGLDSKFFAHMEEIDLCWRLNSLGRKLFCVPDSVVHHVGGASLQKSNPKKTYLNFRNNLLMLYKNLPQQQLRRTMQIRRLFDTIAWGVFVLQFKFRDAKAVRQAIWDYEKMKTEFSDVRELNLQKTVKKDIPEIFRKSIILQYWLGRKKTFEKLNF